MARFEALNPTERKQFEQPPQLNSALRKRFLRLPRKILERIKNYDEQNKIAYGMLYGYFNAAQKFYAINTFPERDIEYICRQLQISVPGFQANAITKQTLKRYRTQIIDELGCTDFDSDSLDKVKQQAVFLASKQSKGRKIFFALVDYLVQHKIRVPGYRKLSNLIGEAMGDYEKQLLEKIDGQMNAQQQEVLEGLLDKTEAADKYKARHLYIFLKDIEQGSKPQQIKRHVISTQYLRSIYDANQTLITQLNMAPGVIENYAAWVKRAKSNQLLQKESRSKYLHLLCFSIHQYFQHHDALVVKFLNAVQAAENMAQDTQNQWLLEQQKSQRGKTQEIIHHTRDQEKIMQQIYEVATSETLSEVEKIAEILKLFQRRPPKDFKVINDLIEAIESFNQKSKSKTLYYAALEEGSRKLQNRVSGILQTLRFNPQTCEGKLYQAIDHFCKNEGEIDHKAPKDFLKPEIRIHLTGKDCKFRVSLYKVLLFKAVAHGIKSGNLNLLDTQIFKSFEEYLIPKEIWERDKQKLLAEVELSGFADIEKLLNQLKKELSERYRITNDHALSKENSHICFKKNGDYTVQTPALDRQDNLNLSDIFPTQKYISLQEIMASIQEHSQYLSAFEHHNQKYVHQRPGESTFYAGIMGYGCQIGVRQRKLYFPEWGMKTLIKSTTQAVFLKSCTKGYFSNWASIMLRS